jgi:hypothetical protein
MHSYYPIITIIVIIECISNTRWIRQYRSILNDYHIIMTIAITETVGRPHRNDRQSMSYIPSGLSRARCNPVQVDLLHRILHHGVIRYRSIAVETQKVHRHHTSLGRHSSGILLAGGR